MLRPVVLTSMLVLGSTGCFFGGDDDDLPVYGTLLVDWTVAGSKAPAACRDTGARSISIAISTSRGRLIDELEESCTTLQTAVELVPGSYVVDAVLLDVDGYEITTRVRDRPYVYSAEASVSAFDFPADSFL